MNDDDRDYEIGYGKPPVEHQFKKGVSGNPKGRRRTEKSVAEVIFAVGREKIPMVVNGRQRKVGLYEAALRSVIMSCLKKGNPRDLDKLFQMLAQYGLKPHEVMAEEARKGADKVMQKITQAIARMGPSKEELQFTADLEDEEMHLFAACPHCEPALSTIWREAAKDPRFEKHKSRLKKQAEDAVARQRARSHQ